uniref:Uncharacterized protein LOC105851214 n=1 Tax=Cicer arietinum TaxID=3827 RepID=A0A1S3DVR7_CICAR|nr:uncharacterized protein LOC105851214 [Cicer arietinum]
MALVSFLGEGASLVRPPAFNGTAYMYWKHRMLIFLEASGIYILDVVENGPFIPEMAGTDNLLIPKPRSEWSEDDKRKETHEGTTNVKRARVNTLMYEYELFSMKKDESISDLQTRFTHIVNNLHALGKHVENEQQIGKIMRSLTREWQPKITAIAESKDLAKMTIATLFGKLREHEMELHRLDESEHDIRKQKGLSLKAQTHKSKPEQDSCSDESSRHVKSECHKVQDKNRTTNTKDKEPAHKTRRAYIAWSDNEESSTSSEEANLCLMVCLTSNRHPWYLDGGCSKHMTGDRSIFLSLTVKEEGFVQ